MCFGTVEEQFLEGVEGHILRRFIECRVTSIF
jgi:hypothetical protein